MNLGPEEITMKKDHLIAVRNRATLAFVATLAPCTVAIADACNKNIVQTAQAAGQFSTLLAAVEAAGLRDVLADEGPFTVFAPSDAAFSKLPDGTVDALLQNPDRLRAVLLQHVVRGKVMAADVTKTDSLKTLLGQQVAVTTADGPQISGARITATDVLASNGVIHVIDSVIVPANDVIETARAAGSFKSLLTAIDAAGLNAALRQEGPFTVFAPTDEAFAKLPAGTLDNLLQDKGKLKSILLYHVVAGAVTSDEVIKLSSAKTLQGSNVRIDASSGVKVNDARLVKPDVHATNGVIHVIDTVLMPE
jgi:transforming growth factor-beta-induced protein